MTDEQQREGIGMAFTEGQRLEAVQIWQRASKLHRDGGDVTFNQLKAVLEAANYWKLRDVAETAITELRAQARIDNCPADAPDGFVVRMLRAALEGSGEE